MTKTRMKAALAAALAGLVVAGCAAQVAGTAEPVVGATVPETSATSNPESSDVASSGTTSDTAQSQVTTPTQSSDNSSTETTTSAETAETTTSAETTETSDSDSSGTGSSAPATYPTSPLNYPATPATQQSANLTEARRMAAFLVSPTFIEPTFTHLASISTLPFKSAASIANLLSDPVPAVAQRGGMITGFSSARSTLDNKSALVVAAFEYPDAASAKKGAADLAAAAAQKDEYVADTGRASIPGFPAAVGWVGTAKTDGDYAHAFLAQGSLVIYAWTQDPPGSKNNQPARLQKTFATETKALAAFKPVPKANLMQQPFDPDHLRAHTIPNTGDAATVVDGTYLAAGELHYDTDPIGTQKLFASAGVDRVSLGRANLYRARDAAGAAAVRDNFIAVLQTDKAWAPYRATSAAPDSNCLQQSLNSVYYCMATRGRYAIEVSGSSENDISAALTAQYDLLDGF